MMKNTILASIIVMILNSVSSATILPIILPLHITTIKYYTNGTHDATSKYFVETHNDANVKIIAGNIPYMSSFNDSKVDVYGGEISAIWLTDRSSINLFNFDIIDCTMITICDSANLTIFGYDFMYHLPSYPSPPNWRLSGKWENGSPFTICFKETPPDSSGIHLYTVPEPSTILLLCCGIIYCKRVK